ncbi:MAG: hypothetical protein HY583_03405, partial [Candidatus Omnitrophica bacterium]|nr:hypothetical protein [Candidatus Omnitrophota bacterium]
MIKSRRDIWFRAIGFLVALSLINFQVLEGYSLLSFQNFAFAAEVLPENQTSFPTIPVTGEPSQDSPQNSQPNAPQTDADFLASDTPLSAPTEEDEIVDVTEIYDTASEGIHELQPNMPVAYVARTLTVEDLRVLRQQNEEVGVLVAGEMVVVFSTGDEHFIRNVEPVRELTESSLVSLSAHFHKEGPPSQADLHGDAGLQYVISSTDSGEEVVWVHSGAQIIGQITYEEFISRVDALKAQSTVEPAEVRELLNRYIAAIDAYREESEREVPVLEPLLYANAPVTVFPTNSVGNKPVIGIFERYPASQESFFTQTSTGAIRFNYDVQRSESFAALSIQFDSLGTTAVETADLSGFDQITFGLASSNICVSASAEPCLKLEFEDIRGQRVKAEFKIRGISTTEKHITISKSFLLSYYPDFRLDQVRFINFVYDRERTSSATRTGYLDVTTGGLHYEPPASTTTNAVTNFGTKQPGAGSLEPCATNNQNPCTTGTLDTVTNFTQDTKDHFTFNFNLANGSSGLDDFRRFGGAMINFGKKADETPESWDVAANPIILGLRGAGTTDGKLKLDFIDIYENKVTVRIDGLTSSFQNYLIDADLLNSAEVTGFDVRKINVVALVVDDNTTGSKTAQGTIEVNAQDLYFIPEVSAQAQGSVTNLEAFEFSAGELDPKGVI